MTGSAVKVMYVVSACDSAKACLKGEESEEGKQTDQALLEAGGFVWIFQIFHPHPKSGHLEMISIALKQVFGCWQPAPHSGHFLPRHSSTPRDRQAILPRDQLEFLRTSIRESLKS